MFVKMLKSFKSNKDILFSLSRIKQTQKLKGKVKDVVCGWIEGSTVVKKM